MNILMRVLLFLVFYPALVFSECKDYQSTRQPLFGELHLHTQYSADAATLDTRNTPREAYQFAKGYPVGLPPFVDTRTTIDPNQQPPAPVGGVALHPYCLPPERCEYTATRIAQQPPTRALDFAAVTDHAELIGESNICFFEGGPSCETDTDCADPGQICSTLAGNRCVPKGYNSESCIIGRQDISRLRTGAAAAIFGATYVGAEFPSRLPFCTESVDGVSSCVYQAQNVWQQIQAAAKEANEPCSFTSFVAYEFTSDPGMNVCQAATPSASAEGSGAACWVDTDCPSTAPICGPNPGGANNLHRNIIFKTDSVPVLPVSNVDVTVGCGSVQWSDGSDKDCQAYQGPDGNFPAGTFATTNGVGLASPQIMLKALSSKCNAGNNCEFISIPHNSNLSGGAMFLTPQSDMDATVRKQFEPLVEIFQIKGGSECRYSPESVWGTADELCSFENMSFGKLGGPFLPVPDATTVQPNSFVRNTLKTGLQYHQAKGVNPFQLGFVGATDNHNGTPSDTEASLYARTGGHGDLSWAVSGTALNETDFLGLQTNGGGITGVWAEENTRDAVFAALKRRETFATSGTRPTVRMFGGFELPANLCNKADFAAQGYAKGVPMGGTLSNPGNSKAPVFAVAANMDPGWPGHKGTQLQRIQIVKGWVDGNGETHEAVYDVAGGPNDASVNLKSCKPETRAGQGSLCAVWKDPNFDSSQGAFYYAKVLENPSCRWNQYYCNARGVQCDVPPKTDRDQARYTQWEFQQCCSNLVPKTVQQRAWGSPIWYKP